MSRPPRIPGFDYRGPYRYFLTFSTMHRRPVFRDPRISTATLLQFRRTARLEHFAVLAYCLMPDHAHFLVEGRAPTSDFRTFVRRSKQRSGQVYASQTGERLWQDGYFERVLRQETDVREVARYIVWNPVRAGLTRTPQEYPHLGSDVLSTADLCAT
jgi:REP element-mobilizing transposase RayT